MKLYFTISIILMCLVTVQSLNAQQRVGINTDTPVRTLEVKGPNEQKISVFTTSGLAGGSGLEMITGNNVEIDTDWKIISEIGGLKFYKGDYNMNFFSEEVMRINIYGDVGLGTTSPQSKLHIDGGTTATLGGGGYMTLGNVSGYNVGYDNTQIKARNNGLIAPLYIQPYGGNTYVGSNGGNVGIASAAAGNGTRAGIGTSNPSHRVSIEHTLYHMYLRNDGDNDANDWYIGASGASWGVGPNQLIFAPNSSSASSVFRLMKVTENDGINAPVIIHTSASQRLLLDGSEIETAASPLYINHNSDQDTYFNVNGGSVGIGTSSPQSRLHIVGPPNSDEPLSLQGGNWRWDLNPVSDLSWRANDWELAVVDGASGQWTAISDMRMKTGIREYGSVLNKIRNVNIYRYNFSSDPDKRQYIGVIAQEFQDIFPELVVESHDQLGVAYGPLAAVVVQAIKEQQDIINKLSEKINLLRGRLKG